MVGEARPFYFSVVVWGARYRRYLVDLLLRSLLAPGNIPALKPTRNSKFLVATPRADWNALQSEPVFRRLTTFVEPVWLEIAPPAGDEPKMLTMSRGHELIATQAFRDAAYGVYLTPDLILSDGSVAALERHVEAGRRVVLAVAIRFAQEAMLSALEREGYMDPSSSLAIGSRPLMRLALAHLHSETLRYEFDRPWLSNFPISVWWRVLNGDGILVHSFSWAPLVVDYAALTRHDTETFREWTLDGDYIYRNFPDPVDVYVVTDSDEISLVSFTPEADLHYELEPDWQKDIPWFSHGYKVDLLRKLRESPVMDPLKRAIFPYPVCLHAGPIGVEWEKQKQIAGRIVRQAASPPGLIEQYQVEIVRSGYGGEPGFGAWYVRQSQWLQSFAIPPFRYVGFLVWLAVARPRRQIRRWRASGTLGWRAVGVIWSWIRSGRGSA